MTVAIQQPIDRLDARHLLRSAYQFAIDNSDDPHTKNGALIVCQTGARVFGTNRLPQSIEVRPERLESPAKYQFIVHAEMDAILLAARDGRSTAGATMYCPWSPCVDCARGIIASGIERLVVHEAALERTPERWRKSISDAFLMLAEGRVGVVRFAGEIGEAVGLLDGQEWSP